MLFVVRFHDKPDSAPIRERLLPAHIEWLDQRRQSVLLAGSLRQEPEAAPVGAFWVVDAPDRAAVEALFQSDPFWTGGLRERFEILHWSKAFPAERALV